MYFHGHKSWWSWWVECVHARFSSKSIWKVSPLSYANGTLSFVSDLWLGSISDQQITQLTNFLDLMEPHDAIMADKGFDITQLTTPWYIDLIYHPKRDKNRKLTSDEIILTRRIARHRIHVERYMGLVKKYRILTNGLSETSKPNEIWKICNALTLFAPPLNPKYWCWDKFILQRNFILLCFVKI